MSLGFKCWQDWTLGIGGFIFTGALIPMLLAPIPPPIASSLLSGSILWIDTVCFATLKLPLATISTMLTAVAWSILYLQGVL